VKISEKKSGLANPKNYVQQAARRNEMPKRTRAVFRFKNSFSSLKIQTKQSLTGKVAAVSEVRARELSCVV